MWKSKQKDRKKRISGYLCDSSTERRPLRIQNIAKVNKQIGLQTWPISDHHILGWLLHARLNFWYGHVSCFCGFLQRLEILDSGSWLISLDSGKINSEVVAQKMGWSINRLFKSNRRFEIADFKSDLRFLEYFYQTCLVTYYLLQMNQVWKYFASA